MAIGTSVFLLAVGAILRFAVYYSVRGVALGIVGIVLMVAGALGLLLSFTVFGSRTTRSRTVVRSPGTIAEQETYRIDEPVNW
ncbi:MAG: DUF6458 family protein [Acidimicrobiales bacterium]|jgi:hypothetical protein